MDEAQRVDLGVALFIPYRYLEDRIFRAVQKARVRRLDTGPGPGVSTHRPRRFTSHGSEWTVYLGTRNFTLLHQIVDQLREITDPYAQKP